MSEVADRQVQAGGQSKSRAPAAKRFERCILHIGMEKTGTTHLQNALYGNRDAVMAQGFYLPRGLRHPNNVGIIIYAQNDDEFDDVRLSSHISTPEHVRAFRKVQEDHLKTEFTPERVTRHPVLLLSSEHCHSRLRTEQEVRRAHDLLAPYVERFEIHIYMRRQDQLYASRMAMMLKLGLQPSLDFPDEGDEVEHYYDFNRTLTMWESVFGREAMNVHIYDRRRLLGGNTLNDFARRIDLDIQGFTEPKKSNPSLDPAAFAFMRRFNEQVPAMIDGKLNPERRGMVNFLETHLPSPRGRIYTAAQGLAFLKRYEAGNEAIRQRYFPDQEALFETDDLADDESLIEPGDFDLEQLFVALWKHFNVRMRQSLTSKCFLEGRVLELSAKGKENDAQAVRSYHECLKYTPGHQPALNRLQRIAKRNGGKLPVDL